MNLASHFIKLEIRAEIDTANLPDSNCCGQLVGATISGKNFSRLAFREGAEVDESGNIVSDLLAVWVPVYCWHCAFKSFCATFVLL